MEIITKQDHEELLLAVTEPVRGMLEEHAGRPRAGSSAAWYSDRAAEVETFSRPLWGLVPYWKGGGSRELAALYVDGIRAGTDSGSEGYWGECGDCDQIYVEMAAMAYGLLMVPELLWEPLTEREKANFTAWLWQINTHAVCDSNWRFFRVLVNIALKHLGEEYSEERLSEDLARFDDFYIGGGWYMDGPQHQKDYYISMAIHFYSLIYSMFEDDEYAVKFRGRAELFAKDFIYWFADDGAALPYGRSLTYRFAQAAFWSACVAADVRPFDISVIKGIISRHLEDWMRAPILDNGGVLSIGYKYQSLLMAEHYNAPGSPMWGLKVFAMLALADDHEYWRAEKAPMPELDRFRLMRRADMLVERSGGEVFAYPGGTHDALGCGRIPEKYLKFAYSTKFGFNVQYSDLSIAEACGDNMLVFDVGGVFCERRYNYSFSLSEDGLVINWSPMRGIRVSTRLIIDRECLSGTRHRRIHTIESEYDCAAYDGGFAVACRDEDDCRFGAEGTAAWAKNRFSGCRVTTVSGGAGMAVVSSPNTNLIYSKTVIPTVRYRIEKGTNVVETVVETM